LKDPPKAELLVIRGRPPKSTAVALLQAQGLPVSDITDEHLEHFFFIGSDGSPTGLVGVEIYGTDWVTDPTGIAWETFHTLGGIPVYGEDTPVFDHGASAVPVEAPAAACCVPAQRLEPAASCCTK
jgi:hypothetical protein